jgi:hypothetical protein
VQQNLHSDGKVLPKREADDEIGGWIGPEEVTQVENGIDPGIVRSNKALSVKLENELWFIRGM